MPTQPEFPEGSLPFDPVSYYYAGEFDPALLTQTVKQGEGLADFPDENGNLQSAVRVDQDVDGGGSWVTVPEGTAQSVVDAQVALYDEHEQGHTDTVNSDQWATIDSVRGTELRQTDWVYNTPSDVPQTIKDQIKDNQKAWDDFRKGLRDLDRTGGTAATDVVWPPLPPAPKIVIQPPPDFVDWSSWGDNWEPVP
jgi:hypothetical protein